jgi:pimeloyl-ACP methyl ester carboxylesterase
MHILFLPGAAGAPEFWHPLGALLPATWRKTYLAWPGLGHQPHHPAINGFDDLLALAEKAIDGPVVIVAQSMGGIIGARLALKYPAHVMCLVLAVTSGGIDVESLRAEDWRPAYRANFPASAHWIEAQQPDLTDQIPQIVCPTLLLWGDSDPISPVAVGQRLAALLPDAQLHVVAGGTHSLGRDHAVAIAPLIVQCVDGLAATGLR